MMRQEVTVRSRSGWEEFQLPFFLGGGASRSGVVTKAVGQDVLVQPAMSLLSPQRLEGGADPIAEGGRLPHVEDRPVAPVEQLHARGLGEVPHPRCEFLLGGHGWSDCPPPAARAPPQGERRSPGGRGPQRAVTLRIKI